MKFYVVSDLHSEMIYIGNCLVGGIKKGRKGYSLMTFENKLYGNIPNLFDGYNLLMNKLNNYKQKWWNN